MGGPYGEYAQWLAELFLGRFLNFFVEFVPPACSSKSNRHANYRPKVTSEKDIVTLQVKIKTPLVRMPHQVKLTVAFLSERK
jgi:hypothetical protein